MATEVDSLFRWKLGQEASYMGATIKLNLSLLS